MLIIDCGLMFPDADMLGIDLVLPDFTYLRENADRIEACVATHGHEDHVGGLSFLLRELLASRSTARRSPSAWPRNRIDEAGLLDRTELITVTDGERRRIGPFDVEFIPVTHSVPHGFAIAVPHAAGRASCTPATSSSTSRRSTAASPTWPASAPSPPTEGIRLLLSDSTNADEHGPRPSERDVGAVLYDLFHAADGPAHHHRLLRQPHPPHPADRRRRHRSPAGSSPPSACRCARTCAWPARWACCASPTTALIDIEDVERPRPRQGVRHLHRVAGRADVGAGAHGRRREPLAEDHRRRHGDPLSRTPSRATRST